MAEKKVVYKVYDKDGKYIKTWSDVSQSPPRFKWPINGGVGELTIRLSRKTNKLREGEDLWLGNGVEVVIFDQDNPAPNGKVIYSGWINNYDVQMGKEEEEVEVRLLGWFSRLFKLPLKDGAEFCANYYQQDPSDIVKDILDKANSKVTYSPSSIEDTGISVSYRLLHESVGEALERVTNLAPYNWFFYVDADNILHFKKADVKKIDHRLTVGKDIGSVSVSKSLDDMVNSILFRGGVDDWDIPLVSTLSGYSSIEEFGLFFEKMVDRRVILAGTASRFMEAKLGFSAGPRMKMRLEVLDNNGERAGRGYDIESFQPGQIVKIMDPEGQGQIETEWEMATWGGSRWGWDVKQLYGMRWRIVAVDYQFDHCFLELSTKGEDLARRIEDIVRNLDREQSHSNDLDENMYKIGSGEYIWAFNADAITSGTLVLDGVKLRADSGEHIFNPGAILSFKAEGGEVDKAAELRFVDKTTPSRYVKFLLDPYSLSPSATQMVIAPRFGQTYSYLDIGHEDDALDTDEFYVISLHASEDIFFSVGGANILIMTSTGTPYLLPYADINFTPGYGKGIINIQKLTAGANLDIGAYEFRAKTFQSDVATGTAPLTIASTTVVANLNADMVDGVNLPGTIANILTDHNKAGHDALGLSHDSLADVSADDHHPQSHYHPLKPPAGCQGSSYPIENQTLAQGATYTSGDLRDGTVVASDAVGIWAVIIASSTTVSRSLAVETADGTPDDYSSRLISEVANQLCSCLIMVRLGTGGNAGKIKIKAIYGDWANIYLYPVGYWR